MARYGTYAVARLVGPLVQAIQIRRSSGGYYCLEWYYTSVWADEERPCFMLLTSEMEGLKLQSVLPRSHEKFFPRWVNTLRNEFLQEPIEGDILFSDFATHVEPTIDRVNRNVCSMMIMLTKYYNRLDLAQKYESRLRESHRAEGIELFDLDILAVESTPEYLQASYDEIVQRKHFVKLPRSKFIF